MLTTRSTLRGKLLAAFLTLVTVITVAGTVIRQGADEIDAAFRRTYRESIPATEALREARVQLTRLVAEAEGYLLTRDAREVGNFRAATRALWDACDRYRTVEAGEPPAGVAPGRAQIAWAQIRRECGKVVRSGERVLTIRPRAHQVERLLAWVKVWEAYARAAPALDAAIARETDALRQNAASVDLAIVRLRTGALLGVCLALALALVLGVFLAQGIRRPIVELRAVAERIGRGEFSARLGSTRQDEIGDVARAVDEMAARLERLDFVQNVLDGLPAVVLLLDAGGRVVRHNRALELPPDRPATTWWALLGPGGEGRAREVFDRVVAGQGRRAQVETPYAIGGGHYLWTLARLGEQDILVTGQDITTRRQAELELMRGREHALETSRRKSEFLARISHEFRTPLHGVFGMTDLLLETTLDGEQQDFAGSIRRSAESLVAILDDVIDFARLDSGRLGLDAVDFNPATVVEEALGVMAPRASAKDLDLTCHVHGEVPPLLRGDPRRLRQVLMNLLGNAVKFTSVGRVVVRVEVERDVGEQAALYFSITDTGIGIPVPEQRRLFESWAPGDDAIDQGQGGTGLGLAVCRRLVEMMGGDIGVESEPGRGSCFWFTVPLGQKASPRSRLAVA